MIERAHRRGRKVGLCGQGPSDHPEFARFLAGHGIDSISVTSDALPDVVRVLSDATVAPLPSTRANPAADALLHGKSDGTFAG